MKKIGIGIALVSILFTACYTAKSNTANKFDPFNSSQTQTEAEKPQKMKASETESRPTQPQMIQTTERVLSKKTGGKGVEATFEAALPVPDSL